MILRLGIIVGLSSTARQTYNKSQQFAADGRRTPFTWLLRRHSKVAAVLQRYVPAGHQ